jgi:hypothetical protein
MISSFTIGRKQCVFETQHIVWIIFMTVETFLLCAAAITLVQPLPEICMLQLKHGFQYWIDPIIGKPVQSVMLRRSWRTIRIRMNRSFVRYYRHMAVGERS